MAKKSEAAGWMGRLPNRERTIDKGVYKKAWKEFAKPLLNILQDSDLLAFDPGLSIYFNGRAVHFDADVVEALNKKLDKKEKAKKILKDSFGVDF